MISFLKGIVADKKPPQVVIEVNQIGYVLTVSMNTFYDIPNIGENVHLYTHLSIREDAHTLFGFGSERERALFRTLIKVNGVGAKLAVTILSSIEPDVFVHYIQGNDTAALMRLPGVGKKTAERLILDMKDRLKDWQANTKFSQITPLENIPGQNAKQDAMSALVALGYKPHEAKRALERVANDELSSEEFIRQGLRNLTK